LSQLLSGSVQLGFSRRLLAAKTLNHCADDKGAEHCGSIVALAALCVLTERICRRVVLTMLQITTTTRIGCAS
jgi:hypothetical protein